MSLDSVLNVVSATLQSVVICRTRVDQKRRELPCAVLIGVEHIVDAAKEIRNTCTRLIGDQMAFL